MNKEKKKKKKLSYLFVRFVISEPVKPTEIERKKTVKKHSEKKNSKTRMNYSSSYLNVVE